MDAIKAVQNYISKMLSDVSGMKALLLDPETTPIISLASTQSALLSHEVYLTDALANRARERVPHLKCVCFVRPSAESVGALVEELRAPKYGEYYLYFSNVLKKSAIERLAEADEFEVVREVQEYFADYHALLPSLFSLSLSPPQHRLWADTANTWDSPSLERAASGLAALLLSLKKRPVMRYERMSPMAKKLGGELQYLMNQDPALFDFRLTEVPPLLIILDRRNDPVTPLLSQWTYQAMVHELLGIHNGRVDLSGAPDMRAELREIVLSPEQDPFFSTHLFSNFGDLGASVKHYVSEYSSKSAATSPAKIETIADMKRFVEEYPEFRRLAGNVSKHVALVGELSRLVERERLLEVSEVEQSLASNESHGSDLKSVQSLIASPDISPDAKLRLAILYALRYQKSTQNAIPSVVHQLVQNGVPEQRAALVYVMLNIAGAEQRQDDLFSNENFFSRGKSALKGLKGVDNVYTQHTPHLAQTLELLLKGRLREQSYPFLDGAPPPGWTQQSRPQEIILFIVGGTTYEEARTVALLNQQIAAGAGVAGAQVSTGTRILLGGTSVLNSRTFLQNISEAASRFPASVWRPPPSLISSTFSTATAASNANAGGGAGNAAPTPGLNVQLGNFNVNVPPPRFDIEPERITGAARDLIGRVRRGVEDRIQL